MGGTLTRRVLKFSAKVGWVQRGDTAVLWVPSLVSPVESNLLFNQTHADFKRLTVHEPMQARIDPRLVGKH